MGRKKTQAQQTTTVVDGAYTNFVSNLNTGRDKASHGHFAKEVGLTDYDYEAVYQDWLAKKIVNRPVQDMLRAGWYYENIDEKHINSLNEAIVKFKIVERLSKLMIWSRLYGVAYLFLGVADGKPLDQPFDLNTMKQGSLKFFTVLKKTKVSKMNQEYLPLEETMGEPEQPVYYRVSQDNGRQLKVHASRLIRFAQNDDEESLLLSIYYTLRNFASTAAGAASLVHEAKIDVIRFPGLMGAINTQLKQLMERFSAAALMKSINGMLVIDKEEEYLTKSYNFSGLPDLMREYAAQTAGAADMPFTILFGQTTSGLNNSGEFDLRNYYDKLATDQNWMLRPILMPILVLIYKSLFGVIPTGFNFVFNTLWQMDAKTRSEVEKNNMDRDAGYLEKGIITEAMIAKQLREDGTYDFIDDQHIKILDELAVANHDSANNPSAVDPNQP